MLDADEFLRHALFHRDDTDPMAYCHRPIIVRSSSTHLGWGLSRLRYTLPGRRQKVIENDVILLWSDTKRVITGGDILGRLMDGIANHDANHQSKTS